MLYGSYIQPSRLASPKERLCFSGLIAEWGLRKGREWRARISSPPLPHHLPAGPTGEASGPGTRMAHCPSPGGQQTRLGGAWLPCSDGHCIVPTLFVQLRCP